MSERSSGARIKMAQEHDFAAGVLPDVVNIVVLQVEDRSFGLIVDSIDDSVEIVVKPLGQHLRAIPPTWFPSRAGAAFRNWNWKPKIRHSKRLWW